MDNQEQEESPSSLLDIPNECIREIFDRLDLLSLCQLAEVCQRFHAIAQSAFQKRFTEINFKDVQYKRSSFRRVLCKFGELITSIDDGCCIIRCKEEIDVYAISVYCTKLKKLIVRGANFDCRIAKTTFKHLRTLKLVLCEFNGNADILFSKCRKVEELVIHHVGQCDFLIRKFPKLTDLSFDTSYPGSDETILKVLSLNPQLQRLLIPVKMDDRHIKGVVESTKDVKILRFFPGLMTTTIPSTYSEEAFIQLSKLSNLRALALEIYDETYKHLMGRLVDAMDVENSKLAIVYLRNFSISPVDLKSFINLKGISVLHLHEVKPCTDDDLIKLVQGLPCLASLGLFFENTINNPVSIDGLIEIVKSGKQLQIIHLNGVRNFKIDQTIFDILVEAFQKHWNLVRPKLLFVRITACSCNSSHSIPLEKQLEYIRKYKFSLTLSEWKCIKCI